MRMNHAWIIFLRSKWNKIHKNPLFRNPTRSRATVSRLIARHKNITRVQVTISWMKSWPWWPAGWWITTAIRSDWWTIPTIRFEQLSGSVCMQRGDEIIKSLSGLYGFNLIGRDLTGEIVYIIFIYEECNVTLLSRLEESIPILLLFFFEPWWILLSEKFW